MRTYTHDEVDAMSPAQLDAYRDEIERDDEQCQLAREWERIEADARLWAGRNPAEAGWLREP